MERTFHMLLYRAFHAQRNALRPCLHRLGLGTGQPKMLGYLTRNGAQRPAAAGRLLRGGPGAVSAGCWTACKRAALSPAAPTAPTSGGEVVDLTPAGRAVYEQWQVCCREMEERMLRGFTPRGAGAALPTYLARAYRNLKEREEGGRVKDFKRLLSLPGPLPAGTCSLGALLVVVETFFELVIPVLMADLIDVGVAGHDLHYIVCTKACRWGSAPCWPWPPGCCTPALPPAAAYGWGASIREAQYQQVQSYAFSNLDHFETSSLVTRMTTDVTVLQNAVNGGLRPLVRSPGDAGDGRWGSPSG